MCYTRSGQAAYRRLIIKRDQKELERASFDLVIIGGGIMGLAAAREAAARGLTTALVEKGDFCSATSANSLKLIHGGLRYLQHADFGRLRQSVRERRAFMRAAPHLVHPLPFLVPTYGHAMKSREAYNLAFFLYGLAAFDRNRLVDPRKHIPGGRLVSAGECRRLFPGFRQEGLTGGAIFYDGQVHNIERLTLSFALAAAGEGAVLANYTRVTGFLLADGRVHGLQVRDLLDGREFEIKAAMVLNAAGPWADGLLGLLPGKATGSGCLLAKAVNIVTRRQLSPEYAVGLECREQSDALVKRGGRLFFVTPWRGANIIGTTYRTCRGNPDELAVTEPDIMELVEGINAAWPGASLKREEIVFWHVGLVPITAETGPAGANLAKDDRIIDHGREDGIEGLMSLIGVKYTTARDVAERAVSLVAGKLGRGARLSGTAGEPLPGGRIASFSRFLEEAAASRPPAVGEAAMRQLVHNYGSEYPAILAYGRKDPGWLEAVPGSEVLRAQVLHGIREEMAVKLGDVILRRTELGTLGHPGKAALEACAAIMAGELGWDAERTGKEIGEADSDFSVKG